MPGDNVGYTPGSGASIAADGSVPDGALRQRVKVQIGTEGIAADWAPGQAAPVVDDSPLLRRLLHLLAALGTVDQLDRQRIAVDSITAGASLSTVVQVNTVATVTNVASLAGMGDEQFRSPYRTAYNTGMRARLN